jgi:hypothetical protein
VDLSLETPTVVRFIIHFTEAQQITNNPNRVTGPI